MRAWLHEVRKVDRAPAARWRVRRFSMWWTAGPDEGRPLVGRVKGSRVHNPKELRPASTGGTEVRILAARLALPGTFIFLREDHVAAPPEFPRRRDQNTDRRSTVMPQRPGRHRPGIAATRSKGPENARRHDITRRFQSGATDIRRPLAVVGNALVDTGHIGTAYGDSQQRKILYRPVGWPRWAKYGTICCLRKSSISRAVSQSPSQARSKGLSEMNTRTTRRLVLGLSVVATLAACGSSSGTSNPSASPRPSAIATSPASSHAAATVTYAQLLALIPKAGAQPNVDENAQIKRCGFNKNL